LSIGWAQAEPDEGSSANPVLVDRDATSDTYRLPGGSLRTEIAATPINYEASDGEWRPIDEGLEEQPDGSGLTNGANSFDLSLPERLGDAPVRLATEGEWVAYRLLDSPSGPVEARDNTATYEAADAGTTFDFTSLATGLKEEIAIANPSQPHVFGFALEASAGVAAALAEDGSIRFEDEEGGLVALLPAPFMLDSSSEPQISHDVHYELAPEGDGRWRLTVDADSPWLSDPEVQWPVHIDPTLKVESPSLDCTFGGTAGANGWSLCGVNGQKELYARYKHTTTDEWTRSLLKFDVSKLNNASYVTGATLKLHSSSSALNTAGVEVRRVTREWDKTANWLSMAWSPDRLIQAWQCGEYVAGVGRGFGDCDPWEMWNGGPPDSAR
jgi:hypothetical protein